MIKSERAIQQVMAIRRSLILIAAIVMESTLVGHSRVDADEPNRSISIRQIWQINLGECVRKEISRTIKDVPEDINPQDWKDDWLRVLEQCRSLELEVIDSAIIRLVDGRIGITFTDDTRPVSRVILPTSKELAVSGLAVPSVSATIESIEADVDAEGRVVSKRLLINIVWKAAQGKGIRSGDAQIAEYEFAGVVIPIKISDKLVR